jgi:predicted nucleic acid-binding protein
VSEAWVVNASPLILFSRIGRLDLVERIAPGILVPNAVIEEVRAGQHQDETAATALQWTGRYSLEDVAVAASIEHWDLGPGEAQVIAHCVGGSRWAVLDDRAARRCAAAHNVPVIGTLGVVLRAKKHRQIESAQSLVKELTAAGMFLDSEFVDRGRSCPLCVRSASGHGGENRRPPTPHCFGPPERSPAVPTRWRGAEVRAAENEAASPS